MALPQPYTDLAAKVRNWGRWGDDDRIGTLNLIDADAVRRGRDAIQSGKRFSLAIPLELNSIQVGIVPGRFNPIRTMIAINEASLGGPFRTSDDIVTMSLQGATHWDGLGHVSTDGKLYNGVSADTIDAHGASEVGIENVKHIASRGILADIARLKGEDRIDETYAITGEDLDACMAQAGITPAAGDVLLIRTGRMTHWVNEKNAMGYGLGPNMDGSCCGPGLSAVEWFHDNDIAAVATDNVTFEVFPSEHPEVMLAVHILDVVEMGLTQGQNWNLEELAADCASDGQYDFMLIANPEPFVGGCGSPTNPVAIK